MGLDHRLAGHGVAGAAGEGDRERRPERQSRPIALVARSNSRVLGVEAYGSKSTGYCCGRIIDSTRS